LLAIAGAAGAATTIGALGLGCGTTRRGGTTVAAAGLATAGALTTAAGLAGAVLTTGGRAATAAGLGGMLRACSCACFRSRISRIASPGLEMWERSNAGFASTGAFVVVAPPLLRPFRRLRTFSASSASIELECVFFSVTPASGK